MSAPRGKKRALPELDSGKIELKAELKSSLNSFLRCRTKDGDGYLVPLVQALVKDEGGVHSNGAFLVSDGKEWVSVPTATKCASALLTLVRNTAAPAESGGQGSEAVTELLRRVSTRLYAMAELEFKSITQNSTVGKLEVGEGEAVVEVGERHCLYHDPVLGKGVTFSPHALTTNLERLQPDCCTLAWFVYIALQPDLASEWTFDALDGSIRSGGSVVAVEHGDDGATTLAFRKMTTEDRMLLDAGHDLSAIPDANAFFGDSESSEVRRATLEMREEMEEAEGMWASWFPDEDVCNLLLYTVAERMLLQVRKECFVLETPSDRGKSALLKCLEMLAGTYARLLPKAGLDGSNKRTARVHELTLSKAGLRMILHDEADRVDWEYLKAESNGAATSEFTLGMGETLEVAYKAMRVITKNAARHECTVLAAPIDVRRKIVHVTGDSMQPPAKDDDRYARIQARCPKLARGLFLSVMRVFHVHPTRPPFPDVLRAGSDLAPSSANASQSDNSVKDQLSRQARGAFSELYKVVGDKDTGTETCVVQKAVSERLEMSFLSMLPMDAFMSNVLRAGCNDFDGDKVVVPESCRGYVNKNGGRQRVLNALAVVPVAE